MRRVVWFFALLLAGCGKVPHRRVIVIGVDGMDPGFVERHWSDLPNLDRLRREGSFQRLATTDPPQSPVAWSTFITGLDPGEHGIFDFVHRDPVTNELFLSTERTVEPRFVLSLGAYRLPLSKPRVESLRKGTPFWQTLSERGVPVTIVRMPTNYPPLGYGRELAGMGTPDLRGTQGTFSFYTDDPGEVSRAVPGGLIRKVEVVADHAALRVEGPSNTLRKDGAYAAVTLDVDVDPERPVARLAVGDEVAVVQQGEWSEWMGAEFSLIPHIASVRGMFRVYAKQLKPRFELYVSPVNIDPEKPALPVAKPEAFGHEMGRYYTQGIAEDTAALRQGVFGLEEFLGQSRLVLRDERMLLSRALDGFRDGFLFFYFSAVDQNSHVLWGRHDEELLKIYRAVDEAIGEVRRRVPDADLMVMSDHGFSSFDRAMNLNAWFVGQGLLGPGNRKAWAVGLNAVYLKGADREDVRARLLSLRDPENGRVVVERVTEVHAAAGNRGVAPDLVVGYAPGYRASWATGLGEAPEMVFEDNTDAWIADHCINAKDVPGVLFLSRGLEAPEPSLKKLSGVILRLY